MLLALTVSLPMDERRTPKSTRRRSRPLWTFALLLQACALSEPPRTEAVGQSFGANLALSYAATLTQHALAGGSSPCYDLLVPCTDGSCANLVTLSTSDACGFPFPGKATGNIYASAALVGSRVQFGALWFDEVRVEGRRLPLRGAKGYVAVDATKANPEELSRMPSAQEGYDGALENTLVVVFLDVDARWSGDAPGIGLDQWVTFIDRKNTPDVFADDRYWLGGQRIAASASSGEVSQQFALFEPTCRRNPQLGAVQLTRASTANLLDTGINYLVFGSECKGEGIVALSYSLRIGSTGKRFPLDLLGWPNAGALERIE